MNSDCEEVYRGLLRKGIDLKDEKGVNPFGGELIALLRDRVGFRFGNFLSMGIGGHL